MQKIVKQNFYSETRSILDIMRYDEVYQEAMDHINELMGEFISDNSGLIMASIDEI